MQGQTENREIIQANQESVSNQETQITHNWLVKLNRNPKSLRTAINAMCFQCMGGTLEALPDGGWKREIRECTAPDCALFNLRPYQGACSDSQEGDDSDEVSTFEGEDIGEDAPTVN